MKTTLKQILEEFDKLISESFSDVNYKDAAVRYYSTQISDSTKVFLKQSIKDALEACRVDYMKDISEIDNGDQSKWGLGYTNNLKDQMDYFNYNTTQYDENVKEFMGDKD